MMEPKPDEVHDLVRTHYGAIGAGAQGSCTPGCCGSNPDASAALGYSPDQLQALPEGATANLRLIRPSSRKCVSWAAGAP